MIAALIAHNLAVARKTVVRLRITAIHIQISEA